MNPSLPLAQIETISWRLARLGAFTQWWHWFVLVAVCAFFVAYTVWMYRRDAVELSRPLAITLTLLRLTALAGILFFFARLERRFERELIKPSRVVMLVDTSQSMGLRDPAPDGTSGETRLDPVVRMFEDGQLVESLRKQHDVEIYRFDETDKPAGVAQLKRLPAATNADNPSQETAMLQALSQVRRLVQASYILLGISLLAGIMYAVLARGNGYESWSWTMVVLAVALIAGAVTFGTAVLREPRLSLATIAGLTEELPTAAAGTTLSDAETVAPPDWKSQLQPRGLETRLGDALSTIIVQEQGGTAAGVVVFTDGNVTAGSSLPALSPLAKNAAIPVFPVGLGTDKLPVNLRVVELEAPERTYAGDKFLVTAHLQLTGVASSRVSAQLLSRPQGKAGEKPPETIEEERTLDLTEGQIVAATFELEPDSEDAGLREYRVRLSPLAGETQTIDNERGARVEIVDRKEKILLLAGGPMWEYMYLRNQLYRDQQQRSLVTVLLQSARPGISQEAHDILTEFPRTAEELFQYDCIVAFDPDWEQLDEAQIDLLERYVGENAGGLIFISGSVHMNDWVARRELGKYRVLRQLMPVTFYSLETPSTLSRRDASEPMPLELSREAIESPFLWLGNDAATSRRNWDASPGVYSFYPVKEAKPGATVYARLASEEVRLGDELPIYMAAHFYGSGRVFYLGSGEMWRMRSRDESLFEEFYTKLIRWSTEARLLRTSSRGVLLVDRDRCFLGDRIAVRASLADEQRRPLTQPEVAATLVRPDRQRIPFTLRLIREGERTGNYTEQFVATMEGDYQIELVPPQSDELLSREVRVRVPDNELRDARRNDAALAELASRTDGKYFVGIDVALAADAATSEPALAALLPPHDQTTILPGAPDRIFEERLMGWLIGLISGVLSLEWLLRRWHKLA